MAKGYEHIKKDNKFNKNIMFIVISTMFYYNFRNKVSIYSWTTKNVS